MLTAWKWNYLTTHKNSEVVGEFSHRKIFPKNLESILYNY